MSIFIISVIIVLIRSFLGVTSDEDCKFTSASLMPDGYFFTKDDKFWITKEGGKLSNPESISEKCKLSNLTRADIAVWWGRHPDDDDCNVGDQKTVYEKSFLLMEKSNDGTCKWCFLWGENEERRDTREENKLLTKWIKEAKPLCEGFDGIAMKSTDQIQITAVHKNNLQSQLIYWRCEGQGVGSHFRNDSKPFIYDNLYQNHSGIPSDEDDARLLTIYSDSNDIIFFVFRNGDRLSCVIKEQVPDCKKMSNLLYDQLEVCERKVTSEESTDDTTAMETTKTITEITSARSDSDTTLKPTKGADTTLELTEGSDTTLEPKRESTKSNTVLIIAVAVIAMICFALILLGIIVFLKRLSSKKGPGVEKSRLKSGLVREKSKSYSGRSPLAAKSEIQPSPSMRSIR